MVGQAQVSSPLASLPRLWPSRVLCFPVPSLDRFLPIPLETPAGPSLGTATSPQTHSLSRALASHPRPASRVLPTRRGASVSSLHVLFPLLVTRFPFGGTSPGGLPDLTMPPPRVRYPEHISQLRWHNFNDGTICPIVGLTFIFPTLAAKLQGSGGLSCPSSSSAQRRKGHSAGA